MARFIAGKGIKLAVFSYPVFGQFLCGHASLLPGIQFINLRFFLHFLIGHDPDYVRRIARERAFLYRLGKNKLIVLLPVCHRHFRQFQPVRRTYQLGNVKKSVANLTMYGVKGVSIVRGKPLNVRNPRTDKQRVQRAKMALLVQLAKRPFPIRGKG